MTQIPNRPIHGQPDDPGIDRPEDELSPLRFESSAFGREVILLGTITLGEIIPAHGALVRYTLIWRLPDAPRSSFPATSIQAARTKARLLALDWIEAAGLKVA